MKARTIGISGSTLKIIAIISMLIDHTAAVVIKAYMLANIANTNLISIYKYMRLIGRLAFPIFCFLLIEGFKYTRSHKKYALRLGIFALISEIPFNLAFRGQGFAPDYQNVFFTLLIGLLVMQGFSLIEERTTKKKWFPMIKNTSLQTGIAFFACLLVLLAGMLAADFLKTDYGGFGVLTIAMMYLLRESPVSSMLGGCTILTIMSVNEIVAFVDVILVKFYNGERGLNLKFIFYLFYPVHLIVLYLIAP